LRLFSYRVIVGGGGGGASFCFSAFFFFFEVAFYRYNNNKLNRSSTDMCPTNTSLEKQLKEEQDLNCSFTNGNTATSIHSSNITAIRIVIPFWQHGNKDSF
jgi:hypothetical protein